MRGEKSLEEGSETQQVPTVQWGHLSINFFFFFNIFQVVVVNVTASLAVFHMCWKKVKNFVPSTFKTQLKVGEMGDKSVFFFNIYTQLKQTASIAT